MIYTGCCILAFSIDFSDCLMCLSLRYINTIKVFPNLNLINFEIEIAVFRFVEIDFY